MIYELSGHVSLGCTHRRFFHNVQEARVRHMVLQGTFENTLYFYANTSSLYDLRNNGQQSTAMPACLSRHRHSVFRGRCVFPWKAAKSGDIVFTTLWLHAPAQLRLLPSA